VSKLDQTDGIHLSGIRLGRFLTGDVKDGRVCLLVQTGEDRQRDTQAALLSAAESLL